MEIKTRVHDGHIFYWTTEAVKSNETTVGFYFDNNGIPQRIYRNSVYGSYILGWESK